MDERQQLRVCVLQTFDEPGRLPVLDGLLNVGQGLEVPRSGLCLQHVCAATFELVGREEWSRKCLPSEHVQHAISNCFGGISCGLLSGKRGIVNQLENACVKVRLPATRMRGLEDKKSLERQQQWCPTQTLLGAAFLQVDSDAVGQIRRLRAHHCPRQSGKGSPSSSVHLRRQEVAVRNDASYGVDWCSTRLVA